SGELDVVRLDELAPQAGEAGGDRLQAIPLHEDERPQVVIEDPGELQRRQRGERGKDERQDVLAVDAEFAGAINAGGVEDLAGNRLDEIAQDEGTEPDLERAVEDDQRPVGV